MRFGLLLFMLQLFRLPCGSANNETTEILVLLSRYCFGWSQTCCTRNSTLQQQLGGTVNMQMFQRSLSSRPLATHSWMASSITHSTKNPTGVKEILGIQTQQAIASIAIIILTLITHRERLGRGNSQGTKCKIGACEHI